MSIVHHDTIPAFVNYRAGEGTPPAELAARGMAKWSGAGQHAIPPTRDTLVRTRCRDGFAYGIVTGYSVVDGWLAVNVLITQCTPKPEFENKPDRWFGAELCTLTA